MLWEQEAGSAWFCTQVWGAQLGLAVQVPWEQQHGQQGAGEEARSWLCPLSEPGRGLQKGGPEVRLFWGGLSDRFKEETSLFTASFRGSRRMSLDSSTSSSALVGGGRVE